MVSAIVFPFLLVNCGGVIPSSGEMVPRAYMPVKQGKDVGKALNSGLFDKNLSILRDFYAKSFAAQNKFITEHEPCYVERLNKNRTDYNVAVLSGVRFKYQPVFSGRTTTEDLILGMVRPTYFKAKVELTD